jgi:hypothetical protein
MNSLSKSTGPRETVIAGPGTTLLVFQFAMFARSANIEELLAKVLQRQALLGFLDPGFRRGDGFTEFCKILSVQGNLTGRFPAIVEASFKNCNL